MAEQIKGGALTRGRCVGGDSCPCAPETGLSSINHLLSLLAFTACVDGPSSPLLVTLALHTLHSTRPLPRDLSGLGLGVDLVLVFLYLFFLGIGLAQHPCITWWKTAPLLSSSQIR